MLERRVQLSGNIAVSHVGLADSSGNLLSSVTPGEAVFIRVDYTTTGLGNLDSYGLSFTLNGASRFSSANSGDGGTGTQSYSYTWGNFVVSAGMNAISATINSDHGVTETNYADDSATATITAGSTATGSLSYSAAQIRNAYGVNSLPNIGNQFADGTGQTIAIVDAYNTASIYGDVDGFDKAMTASLNNSVSLETLYGFASSFLTVYNQNGVNITSNIGNSGVGNVPVVDPGNTWPGETVMDVEWAHAIAPGAKIDLIETNGSSSPFLGLFSGAATAASLPGVSVVSMSWSWSETNWSSLAGEQALDSSSFTTPSSHGGVTFLAASGDGGTPAQYPATSPNVIAVGGTQLNVSSNAYGGETGWSYPTPRALTYFGSNYDQTGTWSPQSSGYNGTSARAAAGSNSTATWSSTYSTSDQGWVNGIQLSTTWVANSSNATNAVYTIYDGSANTGRILGQVTLDQTKQPIGVQSTGTGGEKMQSLGVYYPTSGTLSVRLSAIGANGYVTADAVGIAKSWASGGGTSRYQPKPAYQTSYLTSTARNTPDVAMDASLNSGVYVVQNGALGFDYYGTSLATPLWAGLMAIVDQGRVAAGAAVFNSNTNQTQALTALYKLPASDFNDVTTGYNGFNAASGYDYVTGRGTPIATLLVRDLINYGIAPTVTAATYNYAAGSASVELTFNGDVSSSFDPSQLTLTNLTTGVTVPNSYLSLNQTGTGDFLVSFFGYSRGILPDGNYHLTLPAGSVTNATGDVQSAAYAFDFFVLAGDANRDRAVNAADLNILNANLNHSGSFAQGDFNYDGVVDSSDLAIYNAQQQMLLPPQGPLALGATSTSDSYYLKRESGSLLDVTFNTDTTPTFRIFVGAVTGQLAFNGGSGNDSLTLDYSNGALLNSGVTVNYDGGTGDDTLNVIGSVATDGATFSSTGLFINGATSTYANIEAITFDGLGGYDTLGISGGPNVTLRHSQRFAGLSVTGSATASVASDGASTILTRSLSIGTSAKFDLTNNALIWDYTGSSPATTIRSYLTAGRNGGAWNGTSGINSSSVAGTANSAIGYGEASSILGASGGTFAGQTVDATALLIRFTLLGDANLDRKVDVVDLGSLSSNWQKAGGWVQGDFNYDNIVDVVDLGSLSSDWQKSYTPPVTPTLLPVTKAPVKGRVAI